MPTAAGRPTGVAVALRRTAATLALALATTAGCTGTGPATSAPSAGPTPAQVTYSAGAASLDDPYVPGAGNGGYDVGSYDLDLRYDPATDVLAGTATITATATQNLSRFNLDLRGLAVSSVTVDGQRAGAVTAGGELAVTPGAGLADGKRFVTTVSYRGVPTGNGGGEGFFATADGAIAVGEPDGASSWFPVNDHPRDKATYTIKITVPDGLTALANGVRTGNTSTAGWTTWTWAESRPMAPYLATVVIGRYRIKESTHDGLPVVTAVHSSLPTSIDAIVARTPEVIDFLASRFGPYPFDAMGGVVIAERDVRFALENQTRPVYGPGFFDQARPGDPISVIVHELAHQWYGDSVSLYDWQDLWLNEGFATFAAWLWTEAKGGDSVREVFDRWYAASNESIWSQAPGKPATDDLFGQAVYVRGGLTLQALRMTIGDEAFFTVMRTWAAEQAGRSARTEDFIALAERISGRKLGELFDAWLYRATRPPHP